MSRRFNPDACKPRDEVWCGENEENRNGRPVGTPHQCLKKGFGAGASKEKRKHLPAKSLQQISYIGETYENNFKKEKITNTDKLSAFVRRSTPSEISRLLRKVLARSTGGLDVKAYNATLMWLYSHGIGILPQCSN